MVFNGFEWSLSPIIILQMHSPGGVLFKVALKKFTNSQQNI